MCMCSGEKFALCQGRLYEPRRHGLLWSEVGVRNSWFDRPVSRVDSKFKGLLALVWP